MNHRPTQRHTTPDKDAIALLPPFERLGLERIVLVTTEVQARKAFACLAASPAWGFDTESKPTFHVGEVSDGPHRMPCRGGAVAGARWQRQSRVWSGR